MKKSARGIAKVFYASSEGKSTLECAGKAQRRQRFGLVFAKRKSNLADV